MKHLNSHLSAKEDFLNRLLFASPQKGPWRNLGSNETQMTLWKRDRILEGGR